MHDNALSERGTTNALLCYAKILSSAGHDVGISFYEKNKANNRDLIRKLNGEFNLIPYRNFEKFKLRETDAWDRAYWIKSGENDGKILPGTFNVVHAVFQAFDPHGQCYIYVSKWLAEEMRRKHENSDLISNAIREGTKNAGNFEYLPHIVERVSSKKSNRNVLRRSLGIDEQDIVGIRYGGKDTFDLEIAQRAISRTLIRKKNLHFVFINTKKFFEHPRVHYLPTMLNEEMKFEYLAMSDFFIHGRLRGESFGLSIAESLVSGLPTFVWIGGIDRNHLELVPKEFWYEDEEELCELILQSESISKKVTIPSMQEFTSKNVEPKLKNFLKLGSASES
jgi:hypothetical protein